MKTSIGNITLNPKIKYLFLGYYWVFGFKEVKHKCLRGGKDRY